MSLSKQSFLHGTLLLIMAGMITRLLGFVNRIVTARLMGEEGVGLYMMAMPSLFLIITLTQIGLPIAISKRVAEANAQNDHKKIKQIITIAIIIITCTSIFFTICMIVCAPIIAKVFLTDDRTLLPLYAISPTITIIAFASIIKGYFQGMQNMKPQSIAIVIEQFIRITAVFILVYIFIPHGIDYAAMGAMLSIVIGEIAALVYLTHKFKQQKVISVRKNFFTTIKGTKKVRKEMFSIALPNTGGRLINSFGAFLEPILVSHSLQIAGIHVHRATSQYGELTGYAIPLLHLPTFITNSLSIALVPSISELAAKKNKRAVQHRIQQAVRISFASGALATIVFILFSHTILTYMYGTSNVSKYVVFLAPFFLLMYIQAPLQSALFALDLAKYAMWNSFIATFVKFSVLFILASNPTFGMMGVAIAMSTGIVLITSLHIYILHKKVRFTIPMIDCIKMIILFSTTLYIGLHLKRSILYTANTFVYFLFLLTILTIIYIVLLILLRFITKEEWKQIPLFQHK